MLKKDEILKKAQEEAKGKPDEMQKMANDKSFRVALLCGFIFSVFMVFVKHYFDQPWEDTFSVVSFMAATFFLMRWRKLKAGKDLLFSVMCYLLSLGLLWVYFIDCFGRFMATFD